MKNDEQFDAMGFDEDNRGRSGGAKLFGEFGRGGRRKLKHKACIKTIRAIYVKNIVFLFRRMLFFSL